MDKVNSIFRDSLSLIDSAQFQIGRNHISLADIIQLVIFFILISFATIYFNTFLKKRGLKRLIIDQSSRYIIANLISYSIGTFLLLLILQLTGFNLSVLAVIGGGLGLGIGIGLQDIARNFISGITVLMERRIKIGDFIQFEDIEGYIKEISTRAVILQLKDGASMIIPNYQFVENKIKNYSHENYWSTLIIPIGIAYGTDTVLLTETLMLAAYSENHVLQEPPAQIIFRGFGNNALDVELWVAIQNRHMFIKEEIISALLFTIEHQLQENDITVAFPQRDIWIRNPEFLQGMFSDNTKRPADLQSNHPHMISEKADIISQNNEKISIVNVFKNNKYFSSLSKLEIRKIIEIGQIYFLGKNDILFYEGDRGDAFYIVLSGKVEAFTEKLEKTLSILHPGDFFGEISLMLGIPRTASIKAIADTRLFSIKHQHFEKLLQNNSEFSEILMQALERHQEELSDRKRELEEKGLFAFESDQINIIDWIRRRFKKIFNL